MPQYSFLVLHWLKKKKADSSKTKNIEAITLTKKVFKKQSDRFVYDVSTSPTAKGSTSFDVLKQTPLVSTTDEKTLKIAGKNSAVIYINDKKSNMDAESLAQFLKNTPAENIQKIEVITVPGSEYQVEGSEGIINIVLKKKSTDGINGNFRMSNSQNRYNGTASSLGLNYRKGKLGISGNLSANNSVEAQTYILKNGTKTIHNSSEGSVEDPSKDLGGYLNIDYQFNDKNSIALSWNNWTSKSPNSTVDLFNHVSSLVSEKDDTWNNAYTRSLNNGYSKSVNNNFNLNYELKTDSLGSKLNLNAAYLHYKKK